MVSFSRAAPANRFHRLLTQQPVPHPGQLWRPPVSTELGEEIIDIFEEAGHFDTSDLLIAAGSVAEVITGPEMKLHGLPSFPGECAFPQVNEQSRPTRESVPSISGGRKEFGNRPCSDQ